MQLDEQVECVLDVWLEVSLNGKDFTADGTLNFRYYFQPNPARFGPSGGPIEGNTLLLFEADAEAGFQRLNDGSITMDIGGTLVNCEEVPGSVLLLDDFDPAAEEVKPTEEQNREIFQFQGPPPNASVVDGENATVIISTLTVDEAIEINRAAYRFDVSLWDSGEGVVADSECGGLPIERVLSAVQQGGNKQGANLSKTVMFAA